MPIISYSDAIFNKGIIKSSGGKIVKRAGFLQPRIFQFNHCQGFELKMKAPLLLVLSNELTQTFSSCGLTAQSVVHEKFNIILFISIIKEIDIYIINTTLVAAWYILAYSRVSPNLI